MHAHAHTHTHVHTHTCTHMYAQAHTYAHTHAHTHTHTHMHTGMHTLTCAHRHIRRWPVTRGGSKHVRRTSSASIETSYCI
jgi:hypothetical protein